MILQVQIQLDSLSHILLFSSSFLMCTFYMQPFTTSKNAGLLIHTHLFLVVLSSQKRANSTPPENGQRLAGETAFGEIIPGMLITAQGSFCAGGFCGAVLRIFFVRQILFIL